jgi:hypothetical protein
MASKKKSKAKGKKSSRRTAKQAKKTAGMRSRNAARKPAKKKAAQKSQPARATAKRKTKGSVNSEREIQREILNTQRIAVAGASGRQAADFEGLSRAEQADSESVDELVEEGNLFEAGAVAGVEEADNADEREVHTHEVPEDDVPEEYLDKD